MLNNNNLSKEEGTINTKSMEVKAAQSKLELIEATGSEANQNRARNTIPKANVTKTENVSPLAGLAVLVVAGAIVIEMKKIEFSYNNRFPMTLLIYEITDYDFITLSFSK